jgi:hypothetical protein
MATRYIGFNNDDAGREHTYSNGYEDTIEEVLMEEIRKQGGLFNMAQPCPEWEGSKRVVITIGPDTTIRSPRSYRRGCHFGPPPNHPSDEIV